MSQPSRKPWMIYGANGYTGSRLARTAKAKGLSPVLAGRNAATVKTLAEKLGLSWCAFDLADAAATRAALQDVAVVAHCAGPYSSTSAPMVDACLVTRTHYVDLTGEIDVILAIHQRHMEAKSVGVALCPSMGFDIIPTDCLAAVLKQALPDANRLTLGFAGLDELSPGTMSTALEGIGHGTSQIRAHGELTPVPYFSRSCPLDFGDGKGVVAGFNIPWADVATGFFSTGIPNIEVYVPPSSAMARTMKAVRPIKPLLRFAPVVELLKRVVSATQKGPGQDSYEDGRCQLIGVVRNAKGEERRARLECPNGYRLTVDGMAMAVEHLLAYPDSAGFYTPSMLMGPRCVEKLPDVTPIAFDQ